MKRLLNYFACSRYSNYYIAFMGLFVSLLFAFVIYPRIANPFHVVLDPDGYGALGYGLWQNVTLSYYPDDQPTVNRGPVYPGFVALLLIATNGWWPHSIQIAQCVLFGVICLIVFWVSKTIWNRKLALQTSVVCALHPFLIWYTSRIWIELFAIFLFTALIANILFLHLKPTILKSIVVGSLLGISALCKATFLPFVLIVPLLLCFLKDRRIEKRLIFCMLFVALIIITPWSFRNWQLTNRIIPVHLLAGYNFQRGDTFVENYTKSPFSYATLWRRGTERINSLIESNGRDELKRWEKEVSLDRIFLEHSSSRYLSHPTFLFKKCVFNSIMFWTLGETKQKSIFISLMQVPLLVLFVLSGVRVLKRNGVRAIQVTPVLLICFYFIFHLPIFAFARLSVVLVPTMLVYALGMLEALMNSKQREN